MVSYYQVLGVDENATQGNIKQAYRARMKAHHSDRHGQSDDPIARLITEAYRVLSNPTERKRYDEELRGDEAFSSSTALQTRQPFTTTPWPYTPRPFTPPPRPQPRTRTPQELARSRELCPDCGGRGYHPMFGVGCSCLYCDGKGWVPGKIAL